MKPTTQTISIIEPAHQSSRSVETTLYELIEAIIEELQPGEDHLVPTIVSHLFDTEKIRFIGDLEDSERIMREFTDVTSNKYYSEIVTEVADKPFIQGSGTIAFKNETPPLSLQVTP